MGLASRRRGLAWTAAAADDDRRDRLLWRRRAVWLWLRGWLGRPSASRRRITRSSGNELFELDGKPALDLYERYLGEEAEGLPGTGLVYPLKIWHPEFPSHEVVRTVLAINRQTRSMTFAGDVPQGSPSVNPCGENLIALPRGVRRRRARPLCRIPSRVSRAPVALLVSCIGRKLLMGQRIEDEIRAPGRRKSAPLVWSMPAFTRTARSAPQRSLRSADCTIRR